jgi:hypothetical protein
MLLEPLIMVQLGTTSEPSKKKTARKYVGENCSVETVHEIAAFYFSPNGYLISPSLGVSHEGGWLYENCFSGPFYNKFKLLDP